MTRPKAVTMWALAYQESGGPMRFIGVRPIVEDTVKSVRDRAVEDNRLPWTRLSKRGYRVVKVRVEVV